MRIVNCHVSEHKTFKIMLQGSKKYRHKHNTALGSRVKQEQRDKLGEPALEQFRNKTVRSEKSRRMIFGLFHPLLSIRESVLFFI